MPFQIAIRTDELSGSARREAMELVGQISSLFEDYFDRGWLAMSLENTPIQLTGVREIRQLLMRSELFPEDRDSLLYCVRRLRALIADLRRYLLPCVREKLGISGLLGTRRHYLDRNQITYRKLLAFTFPYNLDTLERLTGRLEAVALGAQRQPA